ncbi:MULTISPECIES: YqzK family protein [Bacillus]|uniref:YqzK family protein n=1 Tax=Bacillus TaxID=1386 RepID=UPI0003069BB7|nr:MULTISPECIES: YqzK family protein [Bacillus]
MKSLVWEFVHALKIFVLFVSFTILFYIGMVWLNREYEDYNRYDQPDGTSLKVSTNQEDMDITWFERLKLFYLNGE